MEAVVNAYPIFRVTEAKGHFSLNHINVRRLMRRLVQVLTAGKWVPLELTAENCKQCVDCFASLHTQWLLVILFCGGGGAGGTKSLPVIIS